jgi:hypothetical protein
MKKTLLTTAILATTLLSSSAVFAATVDTTVPAQTTVHWEGSIADIIPGDNIIITGKDSSVNIANGTLNLEANGTFDSTEIVLESHDYDNTTLIIGDMAAATWTLESVQYTWGENIVRSSNVEVFDVATPTVALVVGTAIPATESMSLNVKNAAPLSPADITDKTATANVDVTMTAAFVL